MLSETNRMGGTATIIRMTYAQTRSDGPNIHIEHSIPGSFSRTLQNLFSRDNTCGIPLRILIWNWYSSKFQWQPSVHSTPSTGTSISVRRLIRCHYIRYRLPESLAKAECWRVLQHGFDWFAPMLEGSASITMSGHTKPKLGKI
jgi:hypothetical protein